MVALTEQERQVVELFRSLDPRRRRYVLLEIARADLNGWRRYQREGEAQLRELARRKGLHWDHLDDEQRQDFIEQLAAGLSGFENTHAQ